MNKIIRRALVDINCGCNAESGIKNGCVLLDHLFLLIHSLKLRSFGKSANLDLTNRASLILLICLSEGMRGNVL